MAQPFILKITNNKETVDFLSDPYRVMDGGFDISLPRTQREFGVLPSGLHVPLSVDIGWREAKLIFEIKGSTRSIVLSALQKVERIIASAERLMRQSGGRDAELSYAFDGSQSITYFAIYGGDIAFPSDMLSIAKIHYRDSDQMYHIEDIELTLFLSGYGYGGSIWGGIESNAYAIPLYNDNTAKTTSGVNIKNIADSQLNWVKIDPGDLPGSSPYLARIEIQGVGAALDTDFIYIGHTIFDDTGVLYDTDHAGFNDKAPAGTNTVHASAHHGQYLLKTIGLNYVSSGPEFWWNISTWTKGGLYMAFMHCFSKEAQLEGAQFALGSGNTWLLENVLDGVPHLDWIVPNINHSIVPLGVVQIPVMSLALNRLGDARQGNDASIGIWVAGPPDQSTNIALDYVSLMPIDNGLRVWRNLGGYNWATTDVLIDDGFRGETFHDPSDTGYLAERSFVGLMEPIKLIPNETNVLYFTTIGAASASTERTREIKVRVNAMPTYRTLAY